MSAEQLFSLNYATANEGNYAAKRWLLACIQFAKPTVSIRQFPVHVLERPEKDLMIPKRIKEHTVGKWVVTGENGWEHKFHTLFSAPMPPRDGNANAIEDSKISIPGIGLRLIRLIHPGLVTRELAVFVQPGQFYIFSPYKGLYKVPTVWSYDWFSSHMDEVYKDFTNAQFEVSVILPQVEVTWYSANDVSVGRNKNLDTIANNIVDALQTGNVSLCRRNDNTVLAEQVLLRVLEKDPACVKAIFLEFSRSNSIYLTIRNRKEFFKNGNQNNDELFRNLFERTVGKDVYAFNPDLQGLSAGKIHITVGKKDKVASIELEATSTGNVSENMRTTNWNMARIFTTLAPEQGALTINSPDYLIPPPVTQGNQIKSRADYLPLLCGIQQVFDLSGTDRSRQKVRGLTISKEGINREALWGFIQEVKKAIKDQDYRTAYILLSDEDRVEDMNLVLTKTTIRTSIPSASAYYGNNMFYPKSNRVQITTVFEPGREILDEKIKAEIFSDKNRDYWKPLCLGNLEEFMHAYQKASRGFISQLTTDFRKYVENEKTERENLNFNEIDILATFEEWKFDPEKYGFVDAHFEDRIPFWEWFKKKKYVRKQPPDPGEDPFADFDSDDS